MDDLISRQAAIDDFYKYPNRTWTTLDVLEHIDALPSAQPTEASCWGCNCPKMERLKEQKTFSEMVHLHDETHGVCLDTISRQAAIEALSTPHGILYPIRTIENIPSAQQTLYGYKIEHLAYIAKVMEKEGITAEYAVRTFDDMSRAIRMIIEEAQQKAEEMLNERFNQQTGGD